MSELTIDQYRANASSCAVLLVDVEFVSVLPAEDVVSFATLDMSTGLLHDIEFFEDEEGFCAQHFIEYRNERFEAVSTSFGSFAIKNMDDLKTIAELMRY